MFGATSEGLPPTSSFGFPQQSLQTMTFQGGLPSFDGGTGPNIAVDSLDLQQEGANQQLDEEGSQEYLANGNGAGDDVSRQRERNRYFSVFLENLSWAMNHKYADQSDLMEEWLFISYRLLTLCCPLLLVSVISSAGPYFDYSLQDLSGKFFNIHFSFCMCRNAQKRFRQRQKVDSPLSCLSSAVS